MGLCEAEVCLKMHWIICDTEASDIILFKWLWNSFCCCVGFFFHTLANKEE